MQTKSQKPRTRPQKAAGQVRKKPDDFASVAKRLGCDEDKAAFEKKLGKIAKATASIKKTKK
jgi:hypothetical protein